MCDGGLSTAAIFALAGTALSAGGAVYSASQQAKAADAQKAANDAQVLNQDRGFWSRNADARAQLDAQTEAQAKSQTAQAAAFDTMRSGQDAALDARDATIRAENAQAENIRGQADQAQQRLLDATNRNALSDAQTSDVSRRNEAIAPAAQNIQTTSPLGTPQGGDTRQAYAARLNEAAANVRTYGQRLAQVSSYTAPLSTVGNAISAEQAGIMPTAAANQLLQAGQGIRLLPSQTAYGIAGTEGGAKQGQIASALQSDLGVAKQAFVQGNDLADLQQGSADTLARNKASQAVADAATQQAIGGLVSTVGNIGSYAAGRYSDTLNGTTASGQPIPRAMPTAPPIVGRIV